MMKYKVAIIGQSSVGKSSLLMRFRKGYIDSSCTSTIGAAFNSEKIWVQEADEHVNLEVWDTAGQERYNAIVPMYFKTAAAIILVYDVSQPETADAVKRRWLRSIRQVFPRKLPVIAIVGNKIDLIPDEERQDMIDMIDHVSSHFEKRDVIKCFTSAVTGENVQQLFEKIAHEVYFKGQNPLKRSILYLPSSDEPPEVISQQSKCCS